MYLLNPPSSSTGLRDGHLPPAAVVGLPPHAPQPHLGARPGRPPPRQGHLEAGGELIKNVLQVSGKPSARFG